MSLKTLPNGSFTFDHPEVQHASRDQAIPEEKIGCVNGTMMISGPVTNIPYLEPLPLFSASFERSARQGEVHPPYATAAPRNAPPSSGTSEQYLTNMKTRLPGILEPPQQVRPEPQHGPYDRQPRQNRPSSIANVTTAMDSFTISAPARASPSNFWDDPTNQSIQDVAPSSVARAPRRSILASPDPEATRQSSNASAGHPGATGQNKRPLEQSSEESHRPERRHKSGETEKQTSERRPERRRER